MMDDSENTQMEYFFILEQKGFLPYRVGARTSVIGQSAGASAS